MAISRDIFDFLITLAPHFARAKDRSVFELGESSTDRLNLEDLISEVARETMAEEDDLRRQLKVGRTSERPIDPFDEAKLLYSWLFKSSEYMAADLGSRDSRFHIDLNSEFDLGRTFDVVINNGTSEHIFDQANVYRMIHNHAAVGGLMIHYTPGFGWHNHGLFHAQPTLFFDLARTNGYDMVSLFLVGVGRRAQVFSKDVDPGLLARSHSMADALICAAMRKTSSESFKVPTQGCYV